MCDHCCILDKGAMYRRSFISLWGTKMHEIGSNSEHHSSKPAQPTKQKHIRYSEWAITIVRKPNFSNLQTPSVRSEGRLAEALQKVNCWQGREGGRVQRPEKLCFSTGMSLGQSNILATFVPLWQILSGQILSVALNLGRHPRKCTSLFFHEAPGLTN